LVGRFKVDGSKC